MRAVAPRPLTTPHGKSALTKIFQRSTATVRAHIFDSFTTLDNFVVLANYLNSLDTTGGQLGGYGAVRHKDQCATDNYRVKAVVGSAANGKTRLVTCASPGFDRFYALEIENSANDQFHIVKGTGLSWSTSAGIFGVAIGLINLLLGFFSSFVLLIPWISQPQAVLSGDVVEIWWDEPNSTIRVYRNGGQVTSLPVDREEIPHGDGYRYFGVMQGITYLSPGVKFTSIEAYDIAPADSHVDAPYVARVVTTIKVGNRAAVQVHPIARVIAGASVTVHSTGTALPGALPLRLG